MADLAELLTRDNLAELCQVTTKTIDRWRTEDTTFPAPAIHRGRVIRWHPRDVESWLAATPTPTTTGRGKPAEELLT